MSQRRSAQRLAAGGVVAARELTTVTGETVAVPAPVGLVHLQFRRFAGCPICNLHLRSMAVRHDEIVAAGVREIVVFHSSADDLLPYVTDLPFAVVADPGKRLYREFGVEAARRALLDPRAWPAIVRGSVRTIAAVRRGAEPPPPTPPDGGRLGLPGDFLIDASGTLRAVKYGVHADDQWPVDTLLRRVAAAAGPRTGRAPVAGGDG